MPQLCHLARRVLQEYLNQGQWKPQQRLGQRAGCFVSLHTSVGELRGCIGTLEATKDDLAAEIAENAVSAATRDSRFPPVTSSELDDLSIEVSVLHPLESIDNPNHLDPKRYGVVVERGWKRGVLLPDLKGIDSIAQQIAIAKRKAGIDQDESVQLWRFIVEKHHE